MPKKSTVVVSARRAALRPKGPKQARKVKVAKRVRDPSDRATSTTTRAMPLATAEKFRTFSSMPNETVRGCDFLSTVNIPNGTTDGKIVYNFFVSPTTVNARLGAIGRIWERFQFKRLGFRFIPSVPATTAGTLTFAYDPDCTDVTPSSYTRENLMSLDDNVSASIFSPAELRVKHLDENTLYYTGANSTAADERLELQGQFYVAYTGPTLSAAMLAGTLMIEYEVFFSKRCYESSVPGVLPTPDDTDKYHSNDTDILAGVDHILKALKALGIIANAGKFEVTDNGMRVGPQSGGAFNFTAAFEDVIDTSNGNLQFRFHPIVKNLAGQIIKDLGWSHSKVLHTLTESAASADGATVVPTAWAVTSGIQVSTAGANIDYFTAPCMIHNYTTESIFVDFQVDLAYETAPSTKLNCHGVAIDWYPTVSDWEARAEGVRNDVTSLAPLSSSQRVGLGRPSTCMDVLTLPSPSPTVASLATVGKGAAAAAPAPLSAVRRT